MDDQLSVERGCCQKNGGTCCKLDVYDWLSDVVNLTNREGIVEVRFKNTRKDYFKNENNLKLKVGDIVAVEASPGHDIGIVSLVGELVNHQIKNRKVTLINGEMRRIYRKAKSVDIQKWKEAIGLEYQTMIEARKVTAGLALDMKIGDVEYQGDKTKAIFYYIAEGRIDFRQLIKVLAERFHIRIEMKQIGARQEAGRIGGIGSCGRELCCSTWISNFVSVTTNAARFQEISLNPQKLAGQCGKLKCCLNFEVDSYLDAQKDFPSTNGKLVTEEGEYIFVKSDIFNQIMYYAGDPGSGITGAVAVPITRVKEIISLNKQHRKPEKLLKWNPEKKISPAGDYKVELSEDSLTRFDQPQDKKYRKKRFPRRKSDRKRDQNNGTAQIKK